MYVDDSMLLNPLCLIQFNPLPFKFAQLSFTISIQFQPKSKYNSTCQVHHGLAIRKGQGQKGDGLREPPPRGLIGLKDFEWFGDRERCVNNDQLSLCSYETPLR